MQLPRSMLRAQGGVARVIATAAGDEEVLTHPAHAATGSAAWMILGGTALFLAGHALFKMAVWRTWPWTRLGGVAMIGLLGFAALHVPAWALGAGATAVVMVVATLDRLGPFAATATPRGEGADAGAGLAPARDSRLGLDDGGAGG